MIKIKYSIIIGLLILPLLVKSQKLVDAEAFTGYVSKNYIVSDELKTNCEWLYAIVRVKTDINNKIINYTFLNEPGEALKNGFKILQGYRFPKTMKINNRPVIFYFAIYNNETCIPKEGEMRFYAPNDVVNIMFKHMQKIIRDDPKALIIAAPVYKVLYATQR